MKSKGFELATRYNTFEDARVVCEALKACPGRNIAVTIAEPDVYGWRSLLVPKQSVCEANAFVSGYQAGQAAKR